MISESEMDLDDLNLVVDPPKKIENNPLIPPLNFDKIYEWREEQNNQNSDEEFEEEEEEEEDEDLRSANKKFFYDGSALVSDDSQNRRDSLQRRKEHVIALLNQTYAEEEEPEEEDLGGDQDPFHSDGDDMGKRETYMSDHFDGFLPDQNVIEIKQNKVGVKNELQLDDNFSDSDPLNQI